MAAAAAEQSTNFQLNKLTTAAQFSNELEMAPIALSPTSTSSSSPSKSSNHYSSFSNILHLSSLMHASAATAATSSNSINEHSKSMSTPVNSSISKILPIESYSHNMINSNQNLAPFNNWFLNALTQYNLLGNQPNILTSNSLNNNFESNSLLIENKPNQVMSASNEQNAFCY
jgi:hypothetical protein